jgi:preprotein translocase subunit YajC
MFNGLFMSTAWAQTATPASAPSLLEQLFPILFIVAVFFLFIFRPQQKRAQSHKTFLQTLKRGDSVLTSGGILGTIEGLTEQFVTLQIADGVRVRILKTQIASGVNDELVKK